MARDAVLVGEVLASTDRRHVVLEGPFAVRLAAELLAAKMGSADDFCQRVEVPAPSPTAYAPAEPPTAATKPVETPTGPTFMTTRGAKSFD
jgi:hypothetical protein